jgi:hypothetical protein
MVRASRYIYVVTAWAVVVGLIAQVLLAGLGLPLLGNSESSLDTHRGLGWLVHLTPILVIPFAYLSRAGSRHWQWAVASALVTFTVPIFLVAGEGTPILKAMHPVSAFVGFTLAVVVAFNSVRALNAPMPQSTEPTG